MVFFKCYTKSTIVDIHLFSKEIPVASVPALKSPMLDERLSFSWPGILQPRGTKGIQTLRLGTRRKWKSDLTQPPSNQKAQEDRCKIQGLALSECPSVSLRWQALKHVLDYRTLTVSPVFLCFNLPSGCALWSPLELVCKCRCQGPHPTPMNQNLWGQAQEALYWRSTSGDSGAKPVVKSLPWSSMGLGRGQKNIFTSGLGATICKNHSKRSHFWAHSREDRSFIWLDSY